MSKEEIVNFLGKDRLISVLRLMVQVRVFETKSEVSYQRGCIGGFLHSYVGQEAVQSAIVAALGGDHWYTTTYRCHALAILLGESLKSLMSELYGKSGGNVGGRGGSMHFCSDKMLGGFGIVGGHVPVATGAAFALKYKGNEDTISVCFLGDGAIAQGSFHEALNLASLWNLPVMYVVENNNWGMGTATKDAIASYDDTFTERLAASYGIKGYVVDGMDFFRCCECALKGYEEIIRDERPIIIEARTERFRGHSISDPGLYRSKEYVKSCMERDPIDLFVGTLKEEGIIDDAVYKEILDDANEKVHDAIKEADISLWPKEGELEEGVMV